MDTKFEHLFYYTKPHKRFVIYNSSESDFVKNVYKNFLLNNSFNDIDVVIQNNLKIENGDLVWIDTFGIKTEDIVDKIEQFTSTNFFEIISNEELETYMFTKNGDSKDLILEGSMLKHKGETRHFMMKKIDNFYIYSPLKLWSQNIEVKNISDKLPESSLVNFSDMIRFRKSKSPKYLKLYTELNNQNNLSPTRCWIIWGIPLVFEMVISSVLMSDKFYVEQENIMYDFSKISSKLENFAQFLNCDFFEIDLQTGETSFYNPENLPEWVNKFLMNSWRHGYFKYYYPELCF